MLHIAFDFIAILPCCIIYIDAFFLSFATAMRPPPRRDTQKGRSSDQFRLTKRKFQVGLVFLRILLPTMADVDRPQTIKPAAAPGPADKKPAEPAISETDLTKYKASNPTSMESSHQDRVFTALFSDYMRLGEPGTDMYLLARHL